MAVHRNAGAKTIPQNIALKDMFIDPDVGLQRHPAHGTKMKSRKWVEYLAHNWQPEAAGVFDLSYREDGPYAGKYAIVNGGHRYKAMLRRKELGLGNHTTHPSFVHVGLPREQEAKLFISLNKSLQVTTSETFAKRVAAGEPIPVALDKFFRKQGFIIGGQGKTGVDSPILMEDIYANDLLSPYLEEAVCIASNVWGRLNCKLHGTDIGALVLMLYVARHYTSFDVGRMRDTLKKHTPAEWHQFVTQEYGSHLRPRITMRNLVTLMIHKYNHGAKAARLPAVKGDAMKEETNPIRHLSKIKLNHNWG